MTNTAKVIITAGASGIGLETAKAFLANGAKVVICDIDEEALESVKQKYSEINTQFCNVANSDETEKFIEIAANQLGGIDTLVNNAGIGGPTEKIENISPEEWSNCLNVCLTSQFNCIRTSVSYLKQSKNASIINVSSAAGRMGFAMRSPYATAKWGVIGLTKSLSIELGNYDIRVNAILPGIVAGKRQESVLKNKARIRNISYDEVEAEALSYSSIKKYVNASDIANQILFLAGKTGSMISGQAISVCGDLKMLS
ncbi:MAG: SDR family oxidoreductase [Paracoccaceae bacterium]|nr:SDR family oxidoreductase [Paracoccaceae bacterium]